MAELPQPHKIGPIEGIQGDCKFLYVLGGTDCSFSQAKLKYTVKFKILFDSVHFILFPHHGSFIVKVDVLSLKYFAIYEDVITLLLLSNIYVPGKGLTESSPSYLYIHPTLILKSNGVKTIS